MKLAERASMLVKRLREVYPNAVCELDYATPLQLLTATILSAQCTDKRVNMVTPRLFAAYPDAASLASASQEDVEEIIRSTGFFRSKARNIQGMARELVVRFGGRVPEDMESLTALPGVGRKTANVVLGNAFGRNEGVVVDTHVKRLSNRLGLTKQTDPEKIEFELMKLVPKPDWTLFSHWLIWHGRRRCFARKPDCAGCELHDLCPSAGRVK